MARARNIKPGFFANDELAELSFEARLLFIGLWTIADREGRLDDRTKKIKGQVFPYDNCDVEKLLEDLCNANFITRYSVDGRKFIHINNFHKHQNPHPNEKASEIPPPSDAEIADVTSTHVKDESTSNQGMKSSITTNKVIGLIPDSLLLIPESGNLIPDTTENVVCSEAEQPTLDDAVVMEFETRGKPAGPFLFRESHLRELEECYPHMDVLAELRKAKAWGIANPQKRKTKGGMLSFLTNWLNRSVNTFNRNPEASVRGTKSFSEALQEKFNGCA